jgi:hypothetical protein
MNLNKMLERTAARWQVEAMLQCAAHGKRGGTFTVRPWANGRIMAEPEGGTANGAIPVEAFDKLRANGWTFTESDCRW